MASEVPTSELNALVTCEFFFSSILPNAAEELNIFTFTVLLKKKKKQLMFKVVKPSGLFSKIINPQIFSLIVCCIKFKHFKLKGHH